MKKIRKNEETVLQELICNKCGKTIRLQNGQPMEGVCSVEVQWGYFSEKDGEVHRFDLCEKCYDDITAAFAILPEKENVLELL